MRYVRFVLPLLAALTGFAREAAAIDGNAWRALSQESQQYYVYAIIDAWRNVYETARNRPNTIKKTPTESIFFEITECIIKRNMTYSQIYSIVDKYVTARPDRWEYSMAGVTWNAMSEACKS